MRVSTLLILIIFLLTACQSVDDSGTVSVSDETIMEEAAGQGNPPVEADISPDTELVEGAEILNPIEEKALEEHTDSPLLKDSLHKAPFKEEIKTNTDLIDETFSEVLEAPKEKKDSQDLVPEPEIPQEISVTEEPEEIGFEDLIKDEIVPEETIPDETIPDEVPIQSLPSEMDLIPVNPLLEEELPPRTEYPISSVEEKTLPVILDKDEILEPYEAEEGEEEDSSLEEVLDESVYVLKLDHLNRLVVALDGSGWIFLSIFSPEESSLSLLDKKYDPERKKTEFVFRIDGVPEQHKLVIMKQDLSSGESTQYILIVDDADMQLPSIDEGRSAGLTESLPKESLLNESLQTDVSPPLDASEASEDKHRAVVKPDLGGEEVLEVEESLVNPDALTAGELLVLAGNYENPGPGQSLERAREYYLLLLDKFPVSMERFKAEERLRYLDRHYFKVQ